MQPSIQQLLYIAVATRDSILTALSFGITVARYRNRICFFNCIVTCLFTNCARSPPDSAEPVTPTTFWVLVTAIALSRRCIGCLTMTFSYANCALLAHKSRTRIRIGAVAPTFCTPRIVASLRRCAGASAGWSAAARVWMARHCYLLLLRKLWRLV